MLRIQRVSLRLSWGGEAEDPCKLPLRLSRPSLQRSAAILADAGLRRSEWVSLVFLIYAASIGRALPIAPSLQTRTVVVNLAILIVYGLLIRADAVRPRMITSVIRDWLPLAVIILAYREVGWFALPYPGHRLEMRWVAWDRAFLRGGAKAAIESLGPVLPSILEIAYALVYALGPFCLAVLYSSGRRKDADRFLFVFATAVLLTYAQLPLWPSAPPRTVERGSSGSGRTRRAIPRAC